MKKISLIFTMLMCLYTWTFGSDINTYIPYNQHVSNIYQTALTRAALDEATGNGAKSLQWKLLAERHDAYNDTTSVFNYHDSIVLGYDNHGNADSQVSVYYSGGSWQNSGKIIYTFDNNNNITYGTGYNWNNVSNNWVPYADVTQTYNAGNKLLSIVYRNYIPWISGFRNSYQYVYTYDASNNNLTNIYQLWDTTTTSWVNSSKNIYTWDANNKQLTGISQVWDAGLASWVNNRQDLYTNDVSGNRLTDILQNWYGSAWYNSSKSLNTYDGNNNKTQNISQNWDSVNAVWKNQWKYDYTFDANNNNTNELDRHWDNTNLIWVNAYQTSWTYVDVHKRSTSLEQIWDNTHTVWVNYYKSAYSYDGNFNETGYEDDYWNTGSSTWQGNNKYGYTYDSNNNKIYQLSQNFNITNLTFENTDQYFYYYGQLDVQAINEAKNQLNTTLFPNPSGTGNVILTAQFDNSANVGISLYDINGKLITTNIQQFQTGANRTELNYNNISSGNYFIQVMDYSTGKSSTLKFVKQ